MAGHKITISDSELLHQWKNVLKFKTGEKIILSSPNKQESLCTLSSIDKKEAVLNVEKTYTNTSEPERNVTLYLAILKRENFELVIQKATEIGVMKIVPMLTQNTVKTGLKFERLEKIAKEASELAGRSTIPEITEAMSFEHAIKDSSSMESRIIFDISGEPLSPKQCLGPEKVAIYIGPEGGFTESEISFARENKLEIASLGSLTLRGETAGIVASYMAINF